MTADGRQSTPGYPDGAATYWRSWVFAMFSVLSVLSVSGS